MLTISAITTAIENQQSFVLDSHAKSGTFIRNTRGRLMRYSGGFTVVYPYTTFNGEKWAFRCWHSELGDVKNRLGAISKAIQSLHLPFLCNFQYVDEGICVEGKSYPTTRMRWIDGVSIKEFICKNRNSKPKLISLAQLFLCLVRDMHKYSLAHGDLQHGNILVGSDDQLYLIDYDSFYCPQLNGEIDIISGLIDYQHPARKQNKYTSEKLDYFSELIIYTSILGIAYNPSLAIKYQLEDSEHMLFESKDFADIKSSTIYHDLKDLNPIFPVLLQILEIYLSSQSIDNLEPFDLMMERMTEAPVINSFVCSPFEDLYEGDLVNLSWSIDGATNVSIDGNSIKSDSCKRTISTAGKNSFVLKASNLFHEIGQTLTVEAFAIPIIKFSANNYSLHKHTSEESVISWDVSNSYSVTLWANGMSEDLESKGSKIITPQDTTTYVLRVIGLDQKRVFEQQITIGVYEPAKILFNSNRKYTIPEVPVEISWEVDNSIDVELKGYGKVPTHGKQEIGINKETTFTLIVTDAFSTIEKSIEIKMLPIPQVRSILVPVPNLNRPISVEVHIPKMNMQLSCPQINIPNINFTTSSPPCKDTVLENISSETRPSLFSEIKSIIFHYFNK